MRRVAITGVGVVSPLGASLAEIVRRAGAGERAQAAPDGTTIAEIPLDHLPERTRKRIGRTDRLCLSATVSAVTDAGGVTAGERLGLVFGTGLGCLLTDEEFYRGVAARGPTAASPQLFAYTVSSAAAGEVSIALGVRGANATLHMGETGGLGALARAADWIRSGVVDVALAGGADACGPALVDALDAMGLRKDAAASKGLRHPGESRGPASAPRLDSGFRRNDGVSSSPGEPSGLMWTDPVLPSEGAAVFVLEEETVARERGARVHAIVGPSGLAFEPTLTSKQPLPDGIRSALAQATGGAGRVDLVISSASGNPLDAVERAALRDVANGSDTAFLEPKRLFGECFAASAPLGIALALGLRDAPPRRHPGESRGPDTAPRLDSGFRRNDGGGLLLRLAGEPVDSALAARAVSPNALIVATSVCYSGNVAALAVTHE